MKSLVSLLPLLSYLSSCFPSSTVTNPVLFSLICSPHGLSVTVSLTVEPQSTFVFTFSLSENCSLSSHT